MQYPGYRVSLNASFAHMKDKIQIDVAIGDIVEPLILELPQIKYRGKPFFENVISLHVYPLETIFSEKLESILSRGAANSRMKDYHDLILLLRSKKITDQKKLKKSILDTFLQRGTTLKSIQFDVTDLDALQRLWALHLRDLGVSANELNLPQEIAVVIEEVNRYIDQSQIIL